MNYFSIIIIITIIVLPGLLTLSLLSLVVQGVRVKGKGLHFISLTGLLLIRASPEVDWVISGKHRTLHNILFRSELLNDGLLMAKTHAQKTNDGKRECALVTWSTASMFTKGGVFFVFLYVLMNVLAWPKPNIFKHNLLVIHNVSAAFLVVVGVVSTIAIAWVTVQNVQVFLVHTLAADNFCSWGIRPLSFSLIVWP